ncbi:RHS repeat domain-containing protein [Streptomyces sp. NPDC002952]|uniref:RHS repeat domain-containing protein n=1 Tax=Streptomyces sp. NPDC002952 TaxID=3364673 RepID=UPI00369BD5A9
MDQLTEVTAPGGAVTAYGHDKLGYVPSRTDAGGPVTTYATMRPAASPWSPTR